MTYPRLCQAAALPLRTTPPLAMADRSHAFLPFDVLSIGGPSPARFFYSFLALDSCRHFLARRLATAGNW